MLERIWIHIQTYTIIALVNSPALLMLWTGFHPVEIIDHGPQSTAIQEAPIEIYSVQIHPEDTESVDKSQKVEESQKEEQTIVEKVIPSQQRKKSTSTEKTAVEPQKKPTFASKISPKIPFVKPSNRVRKNKEIAAIK